MFNRSRVLGFLTCVTVALPAFAPSASADVSGHGLYQATVHYANPHQGQSIGSFDWSDDGRLYYSTGDASWSLGLSVYEYDYLHPASAIYEDAEVFDGAKVKNIGGRIYFKDGGTSTRRTSDYYRFDGNSTHRVIDSTTDNIDIWGLQTSDGADLWAAGGWTATIFTSRLDSNGDLLDKPMIALGTIGGSPGPLAFDGEENLYYAVGYTTEATWSVFSWNAAEVAAALADPVNHSLNPQGHLFASIDVSTGATGMAFDHAGNLYLTATAFGEPSYLLQVASGENNYQVLATSDGRMGEVRFHDGALYVADGGGIYSVTAVPEPGVLLSLAAAALGVAVFARGRRIFRAKRALAAGLTILGLVLSSRAALAEPLWADVLVYYEQGLQTHGGTWADPTRAVDGDISTGMSLGRWSDNPDQGTNDRPVGLVVGFSTSVVNGPGADLRVVGNPFTGWYEPGYVEVARETGGLGATVDGWMDEIFYLIEPSNFDLVGDPRVGPLAVGYPYNSNWSQAVIGYADVALGGDYLDISNAIDSSGDPVYLPNIAYVRIRTATDDSGGVFGYFSTEVMAVEALHGAVPEPGTCLLTVCGLCVVGLAGWRSRRSRQPRS